MEKLTELIEALEDQFCDSKGFLWSKKALVDVDKCISLLASIKDSIPQNVYDLDSIKKEKQLAELNAEKRAGKLISEAEMLARKLVDEHEIVKEATQKADEIIRRAYKAMDDYEHNAIVNLKEQFVKAEDVLRDILTLVVRSKADINETLKRYNAGNVEEK